MLASLRQKELECWERHGYVVLRDCVPEQDAADLRRWTEDIEAWPEAPGKWMKYFEGESERRLCRVENFLPYHVGLAGVLSRPGLMKILGQLFDEPAILYKEKINFKLPGGAGFAPHQDAPAFLTFGQTFHITLMMPIDEMTPENGLLEVVEDRHREGLLPQADDGTLDPAWVEGCEWLPVPMTPRDMILFDSYIPHRSGPNRTDGPRRGLFITYNGVSQGDHRDDYFAHKREVFPPECERENGELPAAAGAFNLGNPIR